MPFYIGSKESMQTLARSRSDLFAKLLGSCVFATFMIACAYSFRLWFTPVPITLQLLGVVLSGLVLGSRWGAISQIQYLAMGLSGLPVFSHGQSGPLALAGPTGGYLFGFVLGAFVTGWIYERLRGHVASTWIAGIGGMTTVYLVGACWLATWISLTSSKSAVSCIHTAWHLGILPFIGIDLVKIAVASVSVQAVTRLKKSL